MRSRLLVIALSSLVACQGTPEEATPAPVVDDGGDARLGLAVFGDLGDEHDGDAGRGEEGREQRAHDVWVTSAGDGCHR